MKIQFEDYNYHALFLMYVFCFEIALLFLEFPQNLIALIGISSALVFGIIKTGEDNDRV